MSQPQQKLGKYEIRKELGKGAMGVVYLAYDSVLEREVALKVMASTIVSDKDLKERFEREAKAVASLQHRNIVTVYDLGYDDEGSPFIAMELLKGTDLEGLMRKHSPAFDEKLEIIMGVCRGLSHAHKGEIVHRDIKPANIFVTESHDVKIMDFGVARWMQSSQTQTGAILGTADYMSPEQIRGHKVDGRSDIFSVGVILYRLLTKKKPFTGENIQSVFFKILNSEAPELILPDGSQLPDLQAIVDRAMAKDASERYATADEMAEDIEQILYKYHGAVSEETIFDTVYDPNAAECGTASTRARRSTIRPGTGAGSGRYSATAPGSVSRTYRPTGATAAPPTASGSAMGRTLQAPRPTAVVPPTRMMRAPRSMPTPRRSRWPIVALVVIAFVFSAGAGYWYFTNQKPDAPIVDDFEGRLEFVETALENDRLAQASEAVEGILADSPNNPMALALKERISLALAQQEAPKPPPVTSTVPEVTRPSGPSMAQRADALVADASMALAGGDIQQARSLIAQGEQLVPSDERWGRLKNQIAEKENQIREQNEVQRRAPAVNSLLEQAAGYIVAEDFRGAIEAYDRVLEMDPANATAATGKANATNLERQRTASIASIRQISPSKTVFIPPPGTREGPRGFESGGGVKPKRATSAPTFPGELVIELNPPNAQPGQPYEIVVRLYNEGNRAILVKFLELVTSYGGKSIGKGQAISPMSPRINPKSSALLYRVRATWTEEQDQGNITATITLIGGAKLTKTISW